MGENPTTHFTRNEISCKCNCGFGDIDPVVLYIAEAARFHFGGKAAIVHSGCRCKAHNKNEGGKKKSRHVKKDALDFHIKGVSIQRLYDFLDIVIGNRGGLGIYKTFVHFDLRGYRARWRG